MAFGTCVISCRPGCDRGLLRLSGGEREEIPSALLHGVEPAQESRTAVAIDATNGGGRGMPRGQIDRLRLGALKECGLRLCMACRAKAISAFEFQGSPQEGSR